MVDNLMKCVSGIYNIIQHYCAVWNRFGQISRPFERVTVDVILCAELPQTCDTNQIAFFQTDLTQH